MIKTKDFLRFLPELFLIFIALMILCYVVSLGSEYDSARECDKYNTEYGIKTSTEGNFWLANGNFKCYVHMKDGTKIELDDFDIAMVKEPIFIDRKKGE